MKTDALFYELFKLDPQILPALLRLDLNSAYRFQSITVKQTEKRFDGYFEPLNAEAPLLFLEIQGYNDPRIYWRLIREVATFQEQAREERRFIAVLLFLDEAFVPGVCPYRLEAPFRLITGLLAELVEKLPENAGAATVLKPLVVDSLPTLLRQLEGWEHAISTLPVPEHERKQLEELFISAILQRFPRLTAEEIRAMLHLTPLEETVAVRQLIEQGIEKGIEKGIERGIEQGLTAGHQQLLLKLLRLKFGTLSPETVAQIESIQDIARLEQLGERILTASSLEEMLQDQAR